MKVLFLTNVPSPYRVDFFNALGKLCELTVLFETMSAKSRDKAWVADSVENFQAIYLKGLRIGEAEAFSLEVIKYLSKKKYDIIVVGMYSSPTGMLAIEYMRAKKIPFVLSSDGGVIKKDTKFKKFIKMRYIGVAAAWLSTGKTTTEYLCHYGAKRDKVYVYPFTSIKESEILDKPITNLEKKALKEKLSIPESTMVIAVGQFIHRKGFDLLLQNADKLGKKIGIYLIGGEVTEEYKKIVISKGLKNIHFKPFMDKNSLINYYRAADVFVLPTREDVWGLVVNEAMSQGLPVVTTDQCVAGVELISNGYNGYIVPLKNIDKLYVAILNALKLNGQKSLITAKKYSLENMAMCHLEIFKTIEKIKED